jgi:hypothetical protein
VGAEIHLKLFRAAFGSIFVRLIFIISSFFARIETIHLSSFCHVALFITFTQALKEIASIESFILYEKIVYIVLKATEST